MNIRLIGYSYSAGRGDLDSTEIYSYRDKVWTVVGKLPDQRRGLRAVTVNNRVLLFGMIYCHPLNFWLIIIRWIFCNWY